MNRPIPKPRETRTAGRREGGARSAGVAAIAVVTLAGLLASRSGPAAARLRASSSHAGVQTPAPDPVTVPKPRPKPPTPKPAPKPAPRPAPKPRVPAKTPTKTTRPPRTRLTLPTLPPPTVATTPPTPPPTVAPVLPVWTTAGRTVFVGGRLAATWPADYLEVTAAALRQGGANVDQDDQFLSTLADVRVFITTRPIDRMLTPDEISKGMIDNATGTDWLVQKQEAVAFGIYNWTHIQASFNANSYTNIGDFWGVVVPIRGGRYRLVYFQAVSTQGAATLLAQPILRAVVASLVVNPDIPT